jgi:hypothetical protein
MENTTNLMAEVGSSSNEIKQRIEPILNNVAVDGLRAWLRTIGFSVPRLTRVGITDLIVKHVAENQLAEAALENTLIGFEEASNMRIYLFRFDDDADAAAIKRSLRSRLESLRIPVTEQRKFAGDRKQPMSPVYALIEGNGLRVKWAEEQTRVRINPEATDVVREKVLKRAVLIADFRTRNAEIRLNPPENSHTYVDAGGRVTADAYYRAYTQKASDVLGCEIEPIELRPVIKNLVEQEDPRVVRIQIDDHTNQKNYKSKTTGPRADVRDDPDWQLMYKKHGDTWAWDAQSFYWLPKVSSGFLKREVYTHINADEGFVSVNADCSDDEVEYVISQIRAR